MSNLAGVDVGQRHEPSGFCVVEESDRYDGLHYLVRHLERIPAGSGLPEIAQRVSDAIYGVHWHTNAYSRVFVDITGLGQPLQPRRPDGREYPDGTIGKTYLVTRLQMLLQTGRLHLPDTREARQLAEELQNYQIQIHPKAHDHYGAFAVGTRDELVTALGMAVCGARQSIGGMMRAW